LCLNDTGVGFIGVVVSYFELPFFMDGLAIGVEKSSELFIIFTAFELYFLFDPY
jgi:hypothetical protein